MTSQLCHGWSDLDKILRADPELHADDDEKVKVETGSKVSVYTIAGVCFQKSEIEISQPRTELFGMYIVFGVLNWDKSPKRKPGVHLRRRVRHLGKLI